MTHYGYMRVSTEEQKNDLQYDALIAAGCEPEHIFADKITGAATKKEELDKLLSLLDHGDTLHVWKLDRLGRKAAYLFDLVENLQKRGVKFVSLRDHMDTSTPTGWAMFQMMGVFAELERNTIRERTKEGVAAFRARNGGKWGRRSKVSEEDAETMVELSSDGMSIREIERRMPYSRSTIQRILASVFEMGDDGAPDLL